MTIQRRWAGGLHTSRHRRLIAALAGGAALLLSGSAGWADSGSAETTAIEEVQAEAAEPEASQECDDRVEQPKEASHYSPSAQVEGPLRASGTDLTDPENALTPTLGRSPEKVVEDAKGSGGRGELLLAPIPMSSPTLGAGAVVVAGYLFQLDKKDKVSPPSAVGGGYMKTTNDSTGWGVGGKFYLNENRARVWLAYLDYDVNYNFFGIGQGAGDSGFSIPLNQSGKYINAVYLHRLRPDLYGGLRYRLNRTKLGLDWGELGQAPPEVEGPIVDAIEDLLSVNTASLGLMFQLDRRDNTIYPRRGTLVNFATDHYDDMWGSELDYWVYELAYNSFRPLGEGEVLASRFYARGTAGNAPFFGLCQFGAHNDLRGYVAGQYRDRVMAAAQVEYRAKLKGRLGYVLFAGTGQVAPSFADFSVSDLLWSAGVGLRFQVTKENPVNYRIDYAIGAKSTEIYFGVGEAF